MEAVKQRHRTRKAKRAQAKAQTSTEENETETVSAEENEVQATETTAKSAQDETIKEEGPTPAQHNEAERVPGTKDNTTVDTEDFSCLKKLQGTYGNSGVREGGGNLEAMDDENVKGHETYTDNFVVSAYANLTQQQQQTDQQQQQKTNQKQRNGKELTLVQKELLYVSQLIKENEKMESAKDAERWNDMPGELETSYFFRIVKAYRSEQIIYRSRCVVFDDLRKKIQSMAQNTLWDFTTTKKTENKWCSCNTRLSVSVDEVTAAINPSERDTFFKIGEMASERLREAFLYLNEPYFAYLKIHRFINSFLMTSENFSQITPEDPVIAVMLSQQTPKLAEEVTQLRHMLNVLFFFERNRPLGLRNESEDFRDQPILRFHKDIEKWILSLGSTLLRRASFDDHMFLLQHLLCCPNSSQWDGASLIQFPAIWDDLIASHFMNVAMALTRPVFKGNQCRQLVQEIDNWLSYDDEELERSRKFQIYEVDMMDIFEQLPIGPLCNFLLDRQQTEFASDMIKNLLKSLCTSLFNLRVYKGFTKFVIRTIIVLLSVVARADRTAEGAFGFNVTQEQLDAYIMTTVYFIISLKEGSLWQFVSELPFSSLSKEGMWQLIGVIHSLPILRLPQTHDEWEEVDWNFISDESSDSDDEQHRSKPKPIDADENSLPLDNLANLCVKNQCEGVFIFDTLAQLARVGDSDIATSCISTLFHIGFIDERTKDIMSDEAVLKLSYLCESNGKNIGYLLRLMFNYTDYVDKDKTIKIFFKKLPLDTWVPDYDTIDFIARVLVKDPQNDFAFMILKRVHWAANEVSLSINRFAALQILELTDWFQKKKSESSFFDFSTPSAMKDGISHCRILFKKFQYFKLGEAEEFPPKYKNIGEEVLKNTVQHISTLKSKKDWNKMSEIYILAYFLLTEHENAISEWCSPDQPALKTLLEPLDKGLAVFILSQLIPMLLRKGGEGFMSAITPKFVSVVFKKIFGIDDTVTTLGLLIGEPMKILEKDKAGATMLAEFWIRCATLSEKWISNSESLAVIEATLNAYFCFVSKELPAQFFAKDVIRFLTKRETEQRITTFSILPLSNIKICTAVKFPLFVMTTLFTELNYLMQTNKFRSFGDYFTKVEQILNYGLEIPEDFEFNIIFWQLALNLFFSSVIGQQDQHYASILQNRSGSMIMRFMHIGDILTKRDPDDTVEGMKSKFFFGAASLLQGSQNRPRTFQEVVFNAGANNQYLIENEILLANADPARQIFEVMGTLLVELVNLSRVPMYNTIKTFTEIRVPAIPKYLQISSGMSKHDAVIKKFAVNISAVVPLPQMIQAVRPIGIYDKDAFEQVNAIAARIKEYSSMQLSNFNNQKQWLIKYQRDTEKMYDRVESVKEEAKRCQSCGKISLIRVQTWNSELSNETKAEMNLAMKKLDKAVASDIRQIGFYTDMLTVSNAFSEVKRVLNDAIEKNSKEADNEALINGICGPLFRLVFETWEDPSVNTFIGHKFISVMKSTAEVLLKFPAEECRLLDFFLSKPVRINFAVQVLKPCNNKNTFCELLRRLLASPSISVRDNENLFKIFMPCFDMALWLCLEPTMEEKCAVLDVICNAFKAPYMVTPVRNYLIESFKLLVESDINCLLRYAVSILLNARVIDGINTLWINLNKSLIDQRFSFDDTIQLFKSINAEIEAIFAERQSISGPLTHWLSDAIPFLVEIGLKKITQGKEDMLHLVANTFTIYRFIFGSAITDRNSTEEIGVMNTLSNIFTTTIKRFHSSGHHPNIAFDLWYFLTADLRILTPDTTASLFMQDIVFMPLCDAPWDLWIPSLQNIEYLNNVFSARQSDAVSVGLINLVLQIYTAIQVTDVASLQTREFYEAILKLCITAFLSGPTRYDDNPERLLWKSIRMKWEMVSPKVFSEILGYALYTLDTMRVDITIVTKKALFVMTVLRMVCGLKLSREDLSEETARCRRDPAKIAIFAGGLSKFQKVEIFASSQIAQGVFIDIVTSILDTTDIIIRSSDNNSFDLSIQAITSMMSLANVGSLEKYTLDTVFKFVTTFPLTVPNIVLCSCKS